MKREMPAGLPGMGTGKHAYGEGKEALRSSATVSEVQLRGSTLHICRKGFSWPCPAIRCCFKTYDWGKQTNQKKLPLVKRSHLLRWRWSTEGHGDYLLHVPNQRPHISQRYTADVKRPKKKKRQAHGHGEGPCKVTLSDGLKK